MVVYSHSVLSNTWTAQAMTLYIDMPTAGLVIDRQGSGTGAITGTNVSVSCAGGVTTQGVPCVVTTSPTLNATVTLTPAADSGSVFQGWSGACTGTSTCQVTMAGPQYVSARFGKLTTTVTTNYYHTDAIGSIRVLTSATGSVVTRHDYAPFGEDTAPLDGDPKRFAGKDLDVESALQNFEARMYRNVWGRFLTVDPVGGSLTDPQRWNRYAYAHNNPLRFTDPSGLTDEDSGDIEIPIPECSEICREFNEWADGEAARWIAEYLQGSGGGGAWHQNPTIVQIVATLPPGIRDAVIVALNESNAAVGPNQPGGFRETGFGYYEDPNGKGKGTVIPFFPGQYDDLSSSSNYSYAFQLNLAGIDLATVAGYKATLHVHVHPAGQKNGREFGQDPSPRDFRHARESDTPMNIVIGARNQQVYFYNGTGLINRMSYKDFMKAIR